MSFLHVVVKMTDGNSTCLFKDLSKPELKKQFVREYNKGNDLFVNNAVVRISDIEEVYIINTTNNLSDELKNVRKHEQLEVDTFNRSDSYLVMGNFAGWDDSDITSCGVDVTNDYISGGTRKTGFVQKLLRHPWIEKIVTGVVIGLILYYLTGQ